MRRSTVLLPIFALLAAAVAGCTTGEPPAAATPTPTVSDRTTATATSTPAVTATPTVIGNGITQLAPAEVLVQAKNATSAVKAVRMRAKLLDGKTWIGMDVRFQGKQRISAKLTMDGARFEMRVLGSTAYFKGDRRFWTQLGSDRDTVDAVVGKWMKTDVAGDKEFAPFLTLTSMSTMLADLPDAGEAIYLRKGRARTINSVPALTLTDEEGSLIYVATEGKPYLLRAEMAESGEYFEFLEFDKPVTVEKPPSRLVIDLDDLS